MSAAALMIRAHELRDLNTAWRHTIVEHEPRVVYKLAVEAAAAGQEVPDLVMDFLEREGLCLKPAKHRD